MGKFARAISATLVVLSLLLVSQCSFTDIDSVNAAKLSSLSITDCLLSPTFSPDEFTYEALCGMLPRSVFITPTTTNPASVIKINSNTVASGDAFQVHSYDFDNITISVTSPDQKYTFSYSVTVKEGP